MVKVKNNLIGNLDLKNLDEIIFDMEIDPKLIIEED